MHAGDDGEPEVSKKLLRSKRNKDHVQEDFDPTNENGVGDGALGKEMGESLDKEPRKPRSTLGG